MNQSIIWMLRSTTRLPRFPIVNQMIQIRYNFQIQISDTTFRYNFQMQISGTTGHNLVPQLGSTIWFHGQVPQNQMISNVFLKIGKFFSTGLCYNSRDLSKIGKFSKIFVKIGKFFSTDL